MTDAMADAIRRFYRAGSTIAALSDIYLVSEAEVAELLTDDDHAAHKLAAEWKAT